jgi:hypothetical protein
VSTPVLIGIPGPGGAYTARLVRHGDEPAGLVPLLRAAWPAFGRDTAAMAAALLAHDWSEVAPSHHGADRPPVPGPGPYETRAARTGRLSEHVGPGLDWLYLLHPEQHVVVAHEATRHSHWLRHSVHHLDPVEDLFVIERLPDDVAAMTVCTVCGAVDATDQQEMPSMVGYGEDTVTICTRCGSSVASDPMFGAHTTRQPWPPNTAPAPA